MKNSVSTQIKAIASAVAMLMGCSAIAISPTIQENSVSVSQPSSGGRVTISYRLVDAPAIVTVDVQTNTLADASGQWVSVGGEHLRHMVGAANRVNKNLDGVSEVYWSPHKEWASGEARFVKQVKAVVTAWPTNNPPPYMAVDLQNPSNVFFYASREAIPGGDTNDLYKTDWILMRKIPAANVIWWMGTESSRRAQVALTEDFYCGIYELTQAQYKKFNTISSTPPVAGDRLPVCGTRYDYIRGNLSPIGANRWPDKGHAVGNALKNLRDATGIEFDFPTEAQWEFACKAGTSLDYGGAVIGDVAWYADNWAEDTTISANEVHEVGLKNPNGYGLYDMHGNVWEVCLEGLVDYNTSWLAAWVPGSAPLIDPTSAVNVPDQATWNKDSFIGRYFVHKGGGYTSSAEDCRAGVWRANANWNDVRTYDHLRGFRFVAPAIMTY